MRPISFLYGRDGNKLHFQENENITQFRIKEIINSKEVVNYIKGLKQMINIVQDFLYSQDTEKIGYYYILFTYVYYLSFTLLLFFFL